MIEIYMIICVLLLLFDISFLVLKNHLNQEFYPKNQKLAEKLREEIALRRQSGGFSQGFAEELGPELGKIRNLITLMDVLETEESAADWFRSMIFAQIEGYQKKNDYEQAYYAYVTASFDYSKERVPLDFASKFMSFLESKSLYTFANAMNALYQFGETSLLVTALDEVDKRQGFYHKKLLVDGLLASKANFPELDETLRKKFEQYTPFLQECLLDFFRMNGYDVSELCMKLIKKGDAVSAEVRYSAMRYFTKYPGNASRAYFLEALQKEDTPWVEQMMAIQALGSYEDDTVREVVLKKVTSRDWYVRTYAIAYLHRLGLTREKIFDILYLRDQYADDALIYQYRNEKEMSRYIMDTIQLLRQQDHADEPVPSALPV